MNKKDNRQADKNGDIVYHTFDELLKSALSFIPGGAVVDSFLNFQGNLQRRRVIEFSESLKRTLEEFAGRELHANDFNNEDFVDIMESVMNRVRCTKSEVKLERYKNILTKQIISPSADTQLTIKYIQFVEELMDIQILILSWIYEGTSIGGTYEMSTICNQLASHGRELGEFNPQGDTIRIKLSEGELELYPSEIEFCVLELVNSGLIVKREQENMSIKRPKTKTTAHNNKTFATDEREYSGTKTVYLLTWPGKKFIEFIHREKLI